MSLPSFTPASSLPRPAPALPAATSNRNASNAHLPLPPSGEGEAGPSGAAVPVAGAKPVNKGSGKRSIIVNACQRGNPVLKAIQNVGWEYGEIVPDYQVGASTCVLYLSLKYHRLHPEYLHNRIEKLKGMYTLRVLLILCDINDHQEPIREITKVCLVNELTVMIAWTPDEAALLLSTYKQFEHRSPALLKERELKDHASRLVKVLGGVRGVNRVDCLVLGSNFGTFKNIALSTPEQLALCPGLGPTKVRRLWGAFNLPFRVGGEGVLGAAAGGAGEMEGIGGGGAEGVQGGKRGKANGKGKGKEKASEAEGMDDDPVPGDLGGSGETGGEGILAAEGGVYSPDWPEDDAEFEVAAEGGGTGGGEEGEDGRGNEAGKGKGKGRYVDPLESDDEEGEEEGERPGKRVKV